MKKKYRVGGGQDGTHNHKEGCFYTPEQKKWPPNNGCQIGIKEEEVTLSTEYLQSIPGSSSDRIDRFGHNYGYFFGNGIDSYTSRSLLLIKQDRDCSDEFIKHLSLKLPADGTYPSDPKDQPIEYNQYKILKPFKAMTCIADKITTAGGELLGAGLARQFRLFEGSLTEEESLQITDKKEFDGKKVPNVAELIKNKYIERIENPINPQF